MDIRAQLLRGNTKENIQHVKEWIGAEPDRFATLMHLFMNDEYRVVQRAAWVVSDTLMCYPALAAPHLAALLKSLENPPHPAVLRNVLKVLAEAVVVPERYEGELADKTFRILATPTLPVAIHVHAMQVLANLCQKYPELASELRIILEDQLPHGSTGYRSRAGKILAGLPGKEDF